MKKVFWALLIVSMTTFAGGGEGGHHSPLELFWKGFNILLFLGIVYWFGRKPIGEAFNNFFQSLTKDLDRSDEELRKAKEELERAKEELEKAKVRADESIALARESAQKEIENAREHALEVAQRIKERAKETIEIELKKAKEELARYGMIKAEEIAKEMITDAFKDKEVQKRYIDQQIRVLEEKNG